MKKICIVAGARPNFIKVAPIIRAVNALRAQGAEVTCALVYAGRADDPTLEQSLFDDLQMPRPDVCLGVDCISLNELTGKVMAAFDGYLQQHATDVVIVVDDLASTMAAAIVTKKQGVKLAHLVAGTRSFDISMPKEINRLVIDGLSDLLFTAGIGSSSIATREGAEINRIYMVGNILMDSLRYNHYRWRKPPVMAQQGWKEDEYLLLTLNRKALMADPGNLKKMMNELLQQAQNMPVVAPLRTMAANALSEFSDRINIIPPLGYLEFGYMSAHARGIITDSGNVAEEATFNHIPCATLNSYTEHIETVKVGSNVLVGGDAAKLGAAVSDMLARRWKKCDLPERWDGRTAERIVQILTTD